MVEGASIDHDALGVLLATWLPRQRWFGGKGRADPTVTVVADTPLRDGEPALPELCQRSTIETSSAWAARAWLRRAGSPE